MKGGEKREAIGERSCLEDWGKGVCRGPHRNVPVYGQWRYNGPQQFCEVYVLWLVENHQKLDFTCMLILLGQRWQVQMQDS